MGFSREGIAPLTIRRVENSITHQPLMYFADIAFASFSSFSVTEKHNFAFWKKKTDKRDENAFELSQIQRVMVFASNVKPNKRKFAQVLKVRGLFWRRRLDYQTTLRL